MRVAKHQAKRRQRGLRAGHEAGGHEAGGHEALPWALPGSEASMEAPFMLAPEALPWALPGCAASMLAPFLLAPFM